MMKKEEIVIFPFWVEREGHCVPGMELSKIDQILCRNFMDFNV